MHQKILNQIRDKIRTLEYVVTIHAEEEMDADGLTIVDLEHVILNGHIIEKQKDQLTAEGKLLIHGETFSYVKMIVVCKISPTGKLVILTVFTE